VIWSSHGAMRPRRLIVLAVAALVPLLVGCEVGNNAPTSHWHQPTEGASATLGDIVIRNVFVLGPPIGGQLNAGQSAGLFFAIVNSGTPDQLISISAPGAAKSVTLPGGTVSVGTNQAVLLTGPRPKAILTTLTRPLAGANAVSVVMTFQNAGQVTLAVPVVPMDSYFATFSPAPTPSPVVKKHKQPGSGTSSPGPSGTPVPGTSPTATPTPTPSTSP
jgi:copper(I)-binding protein